MSGPAEGHPRPRPPADVPLGFRWMYTRGYDLAVPAGVAFQWMADHAPSRGPPTTTGGPRASDGDTRLERRVYHRGRTEKFTRWELAPPDRVTFHDEVYQRGRLVVQGEERYRFLGGDGSGCIVEVTALRRPVGWLSRIGFALFPERSVRSRSQEAELLLQIEQDHRRGSIRVVPAAETR